MQSGDDIVSRRRETGEDERDDDTITPANDNDMLALKEAWCWVVAIVHSNRMQCWAMVWAWRAYHCVRCVRGGMTGASGVRSLSSLWCLQVALREAYECGARLTISTYIS